MRPTTIRGAGSPVGGPLPRLVLSFLLVFVGACSPKIVAFHAAPVRLCTGQSVELTWEASGSAQLTADPAVAGAGPVESAGSQTFTLAQTTTFRLTASRRGKEAFAEQEVTVLTPASERPLVINTEPDGTAQLVARETLPAEDWDDIARIDTVVNRSDRSLTVSHDGREVVLPAADDTSDALRGTPVSGEWEIRAALKPGEVMGDPSNPPPDRLRLLVRISCTS